MITIREYARKNNVSYEAIRKQIKRYESELKEHIIKQNRTQFLDEVAVEILDRHRGESPIVIVNQDTSSKLQLLEEENKNLLVKVAAQADKISQLSEELKNKTEKMTSLLLEDKEKTLLLEQKKNQEEELERLKKRVRSGKKQRLFQPLVQKIKDNTSRLYFYVIMNIEKGQTILSWIFSGKKTT